MLKLLIEIAFLSKSDKDVAYKLLMRPEIIEEDVTANLRIATECFFFKNCIKQ